MGYFDSQGNVDAYVRMAAGYDGSVLVAVLERHLPAGSSVKDSLARIAPADTAIGRQR